MELLKLLNINEIIVQIVCFLLVFFILRIFAWKRILGILDERRERIAGEFKSIEDIRLQTERLKTAYVQKLNAAEQEAQAKINEAVAEAERIACRIRSGAQEDARKLLATAQAQIKVELAGAKEELKESVVELAMEAAERIIREKINARDGEKVVSDFLLELEKMR